MSDKTERVSEANRDIQAGRVKTFDSMSELITGLASPVQDGQLDDEGRRIDTAQPASVGCELPTGPGVWFRNGETWINWNFVNSDDGKLFALDRLSDSGHFTKRVLTADAPRGNWHPAIPAPDLAQLRAYTKALEADLADMKHRFCDHQLGRIG